MKKSRHLNFEKLRKLFLKGYLRKPFILKSELEIRIQVNFKEGISSSICKILLSSADFYIRKD